MISDVGQDLIWILDNDPECVTLYNQTLGLQYKIRAFATVEDFVANLTKGPGPQLLIADPDRTRGSLAEAFNRFQRRPKTIAGVANDGRLFMPDFIIVSQTDNLDFIRFYLKAGARDYLLKPIRPNELVAKVERVLHQISSREILILRNDLDGIQLNDLTFREHQLLTIFLSRPNRAVRRDDLHASIWSKVTVNRKTLDVHLFNLRRKLRPHGYDVVCEDQTFTLMAMKSAKPDKRGS